MHATYVCSDVHSHYDLFKQALSRLDDTDEMYIIGDVIDKGPDGLRVLQRIMKDKRCHMIMGNHEMMMLQYLSLIDNDVPDDDEELDDIIEIWAYLNGGNKTLDHYCELSERSMERIFRFLQRLPLAKMINVRGQDFLLVHACLPGDVKLEKGEISADYLLADRERGSYDWRHPLLWEREETHIDNVITITGHTPTHLIGGNNRVVRHGNWFDIDCGLAGSRRMPRNSRLALLCLNNLITEYFP